MGWVARTCLRSSRTTAGARSGSRLMTRSPMGVCMVSLEYLQQQQQQQRQGRARSYKSAISTRVMWQQKLTWLRC